MKEIFELRINFDYANLLFGDDEGKNIGTSVKLIELTVKDSRFNQIPIIAEQVRKKHGEAFFFGWQIKRKYAKNELNAFKLLHLKIKTVFEPTGEECGTIYDDTYTCEICGINRKQISGLRLKKGTKLRKDISKTIGGEIVVSEKFVNLVRLKRLKGLNFTPTNIDKYYQLNAQVEVNLSKKTIAGVNPWNFSESSERISFEISNNRKINFEKEVYKCPKGHTIGLNLLSEPYVLNNSSIIDYDFIASKQYVGVKRGFLMPEPVYFCSQNFKQMVELEKLTGFEFEAANID